MPWSVKPVMSTCFRPMIRSARLGGSRMHCLNWWWERHLWQVMCGKIFPVCFCCRWLAVWVWRHYISIRKRCSLADWRQGMQNIWRLRKSKSWSGKERESWKNWRNMTAGGITWRRKWMGFAMWAYCLVMRLKRRSKEWSIIFSIISVTIWRMYFIMHFVCLMILMRMKCGYRYTNMGWSIK